MVKCASPLLNKGASRTLFETPEIEEMLIWLHPPATSCLGQLSERVASWLGQEVHRRLTMVRDQRIDVHEMCDAVAHMLGDAGDDHSSVAVADESDIREIVAP